MGRLFSVLNSVCSFPGLPPGAHGCPTSGPSPWYSTVTMAEAIWEACENWPVSASHSPPVPQHPLTYFFGLILLAFLLQIDLGSLICLLQRIYRIFPTSSAEKTDARNSWRFCPRAFSALSTSFIIDHRMIPPVFYLASCFSHIHRTS